MSKFKNEVYDTLEQSFLFDNEPIQLKFSNRVYNKYSDLFNKKYEYINGNNEQNIIDALRKNSTPMKRTLDTTQNSILNSLNQTTADENYVSMMYVPEEINKEWIDSSPKKYFVANNSKREILEEYLASLSPHNRENAIKVMCENTNSKNYLRFLDLSTVSYTTNQEILSNDLINYFQNKYLNEYIEHENTLQRFNHETLINEEKADYRTNTKDAVYQKSVENQNYYNPYDKNNILRANINNGLENNEFLANNNFDQIDNNMYYQQQSDLYNNSNMLSKNDHLNKENIRRQPKISNEEKTYTVLDFIKPQSFRPMNTKYVNKTNNEIEHPATQYSFIEEMPSTDNINDFIDIRNQLSEQNNLRKHNNIMNAIELNNQLTNTNVNYVPSVNISQNSYNKIPTQNVQQNIIKEQQENKTQDNLPLKNIFDNKITSPNRKIDPSTVNSLSVIKQNLHNSNDNSLFSKKFISSRTEQEDYNPIQIKISNTNKNPEEIENRMKNMDEIYNFFKPKKEIHKKPKIKADKISKNKKSMKSKNENQQVKASSNNALMVRTIKINRGVVTKDKEKLENQKVKMIYV